MATKYICCCDEACGEGETLIEAYEQCQRQTCDIQVQDCTFYEMTPVEVEVKITKKEVVSKIKKSGFVEA